GLRSRAGGCRRGGPGAAAVGGAGEVEGGRPRQGDRAGPVQFQSGCVAGSPLQHVLTREVEGHGPRAVVRDRRVHARGHVLTAGATALGGRRPSCWGTGEAGQRGGGSGVGVGEGGRRASPWSGILAEGPIPGMGVASTDVERTPSREGDVAPARVDNIALDADTTRRGDTRPT